MSGGKILEQIEIILRGNDSTKSIYIDIYENSLSKKWLVALNHLLLKNYHLEKNYCFMGFVQSKRDGQFILDQINKSIQSINQADLGYHIDDYFSMDNCLGQGYVLDRRQLKKIKMPRSILHDKFNKLHRYFEDLQGTGSNVSDFFLRADPLSRWHIRQLNLLCHEFESWALSYRKEIEAPEWQRPSQLMCWLNAPRFLLDEEDYELFGIDTISRGCGEVYVGVNKDIGKHHWEVFCDEGRDSRIDELTTSTLRPQTKAAGDFDIEWGKNPKGFAFQKVFLDDFRSWLINNGFDPGDKMLTIGYPKIGQVDLERSFGTTDELEIWQQLYQYLDVFAVKTSTATTEYHYHWNDPDFADIQVTCMNGGKHHEMA